jgi:hypothetical protein
MTGQIARDERSSRLALPGAWTPMCWPYPSSRGPYQAGWATRHLLLDSEAILPIWEPNCETRLFAETSLLIAPELGVSLATCSEGHEDVIGPRPAVSMLAESMVYMENWTSEDSRKVPEHGYKRSKTARLVPRGDMQACWS